MTDTRPRIAVGEAPATGMPNRYAVYFSPRRHTPWALAGASWLGRSVDGDPVLRQRVPAGWSLAEFAAATAEPRRYGWHATLKAPFHLVRSETRERLFDAVRNLAAQTPAFPLPPMIPERLGNFLALRPASPCPRLQALATACVTGLQPFAAPLDEAELARRRRAGLSPRQEAALRSWGYPFVLEDFRFHMTLTGNLAALPAARVRELLDHARRHFGDLPQPMEVCALSVFTESRAGAPLRRVADFDLAPRQDEPAP